MVFGILYIYALLACDEYAPNEIQILRINFMLIWWWLKLYDRIESWVETPRQKYNLWLSARCFNLDIICLHSKNRRKYFNDYLRWLSKLSMYSKNDPEYQLLPEINALPVLQAHKRTRNFHFNKINEHEITFRFHRFIYFTRNHNGAEPFQALEFQK